MLLVDVSALNLKKIVRLDPDPENYAQVKAVGLSFWPLLLAAETFSDPDY
jgi:hypothetical protein